MASTNIGLILIKKDAAAENIRVPPFILQALLRSVGDNVPATAVNQAIDANASNGRIIAYIAAAPFQYVLNSLQVAETARVAQHSAEVYSPAIYYDIRDGNGVITAVTYVGATNAITPDANLKTIQFTKEDVNEYRKIWTPTVAAAAADDVFFATRIKLVTTVFSKIYDQLPELDKAAVNVLAITALNNAYDSTLLAVIMQDTVANDAAAAAANIGKAFIRFFKRVIIGQGMASQSFTDAAAASTTASTSKADVELFTHYLNDTTEGASVLSNKVDITDETRKNIEYYFKDYLNAKKEESLAGGYKVGGTRRRNKSSKRRSQKKSRKSRKLKKRSNKRKGKKSRKRMRKSYK